MSKKVICLKATILRGEHTSKEGLAIDTNSDEWRHEDVEYKPCKQDKKGLNHKKEQSGK